MKYVRFMFLIVLMLTAACAPAPTATPIATPAPTAIAALVSTPLPTETRLPTSTPLPIATAQTTNTPTPTNTPMETSAPTATATVTPTVLPKPTITGLKDVTYPDTQLLSGAIQVYAKTMGLGPEKVATGITYRQLKDKSGNLFVVAITEDGTPILIYDTDKSWKLATLRNLADKGGLNIGVVIAIGYIQTWQKESSKMIPMVVSNFNQFQIGYDLMWWNSDYPENSVRPTRDTFNLHWPDLAAQFASQHNMRLEGTPLISHIPEFVPPWLKNLDSTKPNYKSELLSIIENGIKTISGRYPQMTNWVVISELENPYFKNIWTAAFGLDDVTWLQQIFQWAHETNPSAKLSYSDFDIEFGGPKADRVFSILKALKAKGTPIDTIAFQMHLNGKDFASEQDLQTKARALQVEIARYKSIGIDVIVGEWDIDMGSVSNNQTERFQIQAKIYETLAKTLLEAGVTTIDFFGPPDRLNWKEDPKNGSGPNADPTLFADDYSPKPSYYSMLRVLVQ